MDYPQLNLDNTPVLPDNHPVWAKKITQYLLILIILTLAAAGLIYRNYTLVQWPSEGAAYDVKTLKPKDVGIFQTVKNFIFHSNNILKGQDDDRINILLLGMGGTGHDGPYLTDTNIIVSIKPSAKEAALISVPRDLGIKIPEYGWKRINEANSIGEIAEPGQGGNYAREIFSDIFSLEIPYYVRVDFRAFVEIINSLGGIKINVPRTFTDTAYPGPNASYQTVHFEAGEQTLSGEQALMFSRSRHGDNGEGSDFARARRQQLVLAALKEKLLSFSAYANPVVAQQLFDSLSNHVATNLNFGQIMYLASLAKEMDNPVENLVLDSSVNGFLINSTGENGAFILSPKTGDFAIINATIKNIFEAEWKANAADAGTTPTTATGLTAKNSVFFPSLKIEVQNGTWKMGLATRIKKRLEDKGFVVTTVGNSFKRPLDKTAIYIMRDGVDSGALKILTTELNAPAATVLPEWIDIAYDNTSTPEDESGMKYNNDTDILVIVGNDIKE